MSTVDRLAQKKATELTEIVMFCNQHDLTITISKESLTIDLPCGGTTIVNFDPVGCRYSAERAIYEQLKAVKILLRSIEENAKVILNEATLLNNYHNESV